jgi:hypothetical protein
MAQGDQTLAAKRTALKFVSGAMVTTCRDYLARVRAQDFIDEAVANRAVASEYVLCDSVAMLRGAAISGDDPFATERGQVLARRLDVSTFRSSLGPRIDDSHRVLADFAPSVTTSATEASLGGLDWRFRLRIVAVGDFDRDGTADWLVWLTDEAKDGNYRDYRALLIPNVSRPGLLAARGSCVVP